MKNQITISRAQLLHPAIRDQVTQFIDDIEDKTGRTYLIVQGMRTFPEQDAIYAQGRTKPGKIVTQAKAGQSFHNYGIAIDICPFAIGGTELDWNFDFHILRNLALKHGLQCGMDFPHPDLDHFENKFGHTWQDLLQKYNAGDFLNGTKFVVLS